MTTTSPVIASDGLRAFVQRVWDGKIVPSLAEYVTIPAKSPMFDPAWRKHGHLDRAVTHAEAWARSRPVEGLRTEIVRAEGRTPVLVVEVPGHREETVLLYGHLDKQPEMVGWSDGLGPWTPVVRGDRLYGRGAGDDGYAVYAALTAVEVLQVAAIPHARCVILVETCEESGSADLPFYVERLAARLREPSLVVCLDASCGNYDQLWGATSLRGLVTGDLTVEILEEGVHSGASGIVPSSFRILRQLLSRLEDERTREIRPRELSVDVPVDRLAQTREGRGFWATRSTAATPGSPGPDPWPGITRSSCSTARGGRPSLSPAPADCPSCRTPGTCCGRRPRSSSRFASRRRRTPRERRRS